ncbi:MAG: DNA (cytosine-5-)-methyltransferase [Candidatus Enteromonas sp.]|nr:DNA (cytosine-5-)-methyltransferase [Candidatus Enteromonas sp.]
MELTAIELFAGVGGFRVGLNGIKGFDSETGRAIENGPWSFLWANQWEPATKLQHAYNCYALRFGKEDSSNVDINLVNKKKDIPAHTLLTGGFPCQDYSVAHPKNSEQGIEGKKGVLWWQINDILIAKKPPFVLLENVDRLLKAPSSQRGQAFGIILRCFNDAGYGVQWRVINAAEYGHAQKRRRTFIFAFHKSTAYYKSFSKIAKSKTNEGAILDGMMFSAGFPCKKKAGSEVVVGSVSKDSYADLVEVSNKFAFPFGNAGFSLKHSITTLDVVPSVEIKPKTLGEILDCENVPSFCYKANVEKFKYLKGAKKISRTAKNGHQYVFSEGPVPFPDYLDQPGRTMLTSEGTTNRSSHLILDPVSEKYRILTPVECERLDEFPDGWTDTGMPQKFRYFIAGNALVTGLVKTMGQEISQIVSTEK